MNNIESTVFISVIEYPKELPNFFRSLKKEYFSKEAQVIYDVLWENFTNKKPIEIGYILPQLHEKHALTLLEAIPSENVVHYYDFLVQAYNKVQYGNIANAISTCLNKNINIDLNNILAKYAIDSSVKSKTLKELLCYIEENDIVFPKYELGVNFLDHALGGGIELSQLVLISGEYESGKTSLCLQILRNLAKFNKCAYFCFEFPKEKYAMGEKKTLGSLVMQKKLRDEEAENILNNIHVIDEGMNVSDVVANILFLASSGVKFFVIDSQMRLNVEQAMNVEESESNKFNALATLCNKYQIVIFLIVQTSKNDNRSPLGSKKGGHDASIMLRIEHNKSEDKSHDFDPHSRTITVQKNKQTGNHPKYEVLFDIEHKTFHSKDITKDSTTMANEVTYKTKILDLEDF